MVNGEMINDEEEGRAAKAKPVPIPSKLKVVIKFGYTEGLKNAFTPQNLTFDSWITSVFTHTQAHFRHESLGTEIVFEVRPIYTIYQYMLGFSKCFDKVFSTS